MRIIALIEDPDTVEYAIGDVHGYLDNLVTALRLCENDAASRGMRARIHLLGDYVDRGPDSRGVIELLMEGPKSADAEWLPLRGNHDHVFAAVCRDPAHELAREWWEHGGQQTLMSYGWHPLSHSFPSDIGSWVPKEHSDFLASLPLGHTVGGRLYVHAGVRPGRSLAEQTDRDLMWIRSEFLKYKEDFGHVVVHGHSPEAANPQDHGNRIAMDGGCFFTGNLAIAAFDPGVPAPRFMVAKALQFEPVRRAAADPLPAP
jgi:serine/threonine protein phosphatase 1|nr:metallophosphoesterase family protein [Neorhizobium tomejilense]